MAGSARKLSTTKSGCVSVACVNVLPEDEVSIVLGRRPLHLTCDSIESKQASAFVICRQVEDAFILRSMCSKAFTPPEHEVVEVVTIV